MDILGRGYRIFRFLLAGAALFEMRQDMILLLLETSRQLLVAPGPIFVFPISQLSMALIWVEWEERRDVTMPWPHSRDGHRIMILPTWYPIFEVQLL